MSVTSPTPSMQEEMDEEDRNRLSQSELESVLTEGDDLNPNTIQPGSPPPRIGVTVESFYPPEEAKHFVAEVLSLAGIDNPLSIDYEFQRYVIQNDHCYTNLTSPVKEKATPFRKTFNKNVYQKQTPSKISPANKEEPTPSKSEKDEVRTVRSRKPSVKLVESISSEKEKVKEVEEIIANESTSEPKPTVAVEETESEYESEMSASSSEDNDNESDLDFDINRLNRPPKKKKKKMGKDKAKHLRKIAKKRHSTKSVDSEMESMLRELDGGKEKKSATRTPKKTPPSEKKIAPLRKVVSKGKQPPSEVPDESSPSTTVPVTTIKKEEPVKKEIPKPEPVPVPVQLQKKEKKKDIHMDALFNDMSSLFSKPDKIKTSSIIIKTGPQAKKAFNQAIPGPSTNKNIKQSIQTNVEAIPFGSDQEKLELIDSIVKKEMEATNAPIGNQDIPEELPNIVKMLENPEVQNANENIDDTALLETLGDSLPEDFLQHVAELAENKEIQEIIDKQVLGVGIEEHPLTDTSISSSIAAAPITSTPIQQKVGNIKVGNISLTEARKHPLQVMRADGRVITLPPIEVPTTRGAKKRAQTGDISSLNITPVGSPPPVPDTPAKIKKSESKDGKETKKAKSRDQSREKSTSRRSSVNRSSTETRRDSVSGSSGGRTKRKITNPAVLALLNDQQDSESGESWNSEDDPDR